MAVAEEVNHKDPRHIIQPPPRHIIMCIRVANAVADVAFDVVAPVSVAVAVVEALVYMATSMASVATDRIHRR